MRVLLRVVIALAVLAAIAFGADVYARHAIVSRIADPVEQQAGQRPEVTIRGPLVLPQVIGGELQWVDGSLPEVTYNDLTFHDVTVTVRGVDVHAPRTADHLSVSAGISLDEINRLYSTMSPVGTLRTANGQIAVEVDVLGLLVQAVFTPEVTPDAIILNPSAFLANGERFDITGLGDVLGDLDTQITIPLNLPDGLDLTGVAVDGEGVRATIEGEDVPLEDLASTVG